MPEDITALRERLQKKKGDGQSSGTTIMKTEFPCLYELFVNSETSKTGKAGFVVGVQYDAPHWQVRVSWDCDGLVAFFLTDHIDDLWGQIERRLVDATLDWRTSKFKWN